MTEFMCKHPIISLIMVSLVCDTVIVCAKIVTGKEVAPLNPIHVTVSNEGEPKGD